MSRLAALKTSFEDAKSAIEKIERSATEASRDLTDAEQADVDKLYARAAELKPQIEAEADKVQNVADVTSILSRVNGHVAPSVQRAATEDLTAGEFLSAALQRQAGMDNELVQRAAQVVADNAGIVPSPIVGNLIEMYDSSRPVFSSFSARPMPDKGKTFTRPEISQHVLTGNQAAEFDAVASQKMVITGNTVTKETEAGYLDLSAQDVDWTDPSALELVLQDFAKVYSRRTEVRACAYLVTTASASAAWAVSDVGAAVGTFVDAFLAVSNSADEEADTIWIDKNSWATLAKLTNTGDDRTAISMINEALSTYGVTAPRWVVAKQFSGAKRIVGSSRLIESYEQTKGLLQVAQPDVLGQRIAYHGYVAFHGTPEGFVNLI